ncbi:hypothetical protein AV540_04425, partial [Brevibacillus parabrevis]|uniref:hypothetical protein n=1 Tax=Brevibacillus parabrevis TaxID=54914 RepID=UPI0007ABB753
VQLSVADPICNRLGFLINQRIKGENMNIAVIGSGGRELVLIERLIYENNSVFVLTNATNPYLNYLQKLNCNVDVDTNFTIERICQFAEKNKIEIIFVMREKFVHDGLADKLTQRNIACFFPSISASFLEKDKVRTKGIVRKLFPGVSTPLRSFKDYTSLNNYCNENDESVLLIKSGDQYIKEIIHHSELSHYIGTDISNIWIDEYFNGEDITITGLSDGKNIVFFPIVYDFPHLLNGNKKIKTGGMGAILLSSSERTISAKAESKCQEVMTGVLKDVMSEVEVKGFVVGQFRISGDNVFFIEFDLHPGEPEFINALKILESSFTECIIQPFLNQTLSQENLVFNERKSSVSLCIAPLGYPSILNKNQEINLRNDMVLIPECKIYWSGAFTDGTG